MEGIGYERTPDKKAVTTSEKFYGASNTDENESTGLGYMPEMGAQVVPEAEEKATDTQYKELNKMNFDNTDTLMTAKKEEEEGVILQQQVFNKTEQMQDESIADDYIERVQAQVKQPDLEYTESELAQVPEWQESGKILRDHFKAHGFQGTDADLALQMGNEMIANIGGINVSGEGERATGGLMPMVVSAINSGDPKVMNALMYTMEMYDRKPMTTRGWVDGAKYMFGDLSMYTGLGFVANAGSKIAGKSMTVGIAKRMLSEALEKLATSGVVDVAGADALKQGGRAVAKKVANNVVTKKMLNNPATRLMARNPVTTEAMKQGALWSGKEELAKEMIKARSGVRGGDGWGEIDVTNILETMGWGAGAGAVMVKVPEYVWKRGAEAVTDFVNGKISKMRPTTQTKGGRSATKEPYTGLRRGSIGGDSENAVKTVDSVLSEAKNLEGRAMLNKLNEIDMRNLTPEDKQKVIDFRKQVQPAKKKPKTKAIVVNEDFNENIYSVLENEITQLDPKKKYTIKELSKLFSNVTKNEMEGSGIADTLKASPEGVMGAELQDVISARQDKLNKVVYHSGDEGIKSEALDRQDWESDYVTDDGWQNAPDWVESESGMGYKYTDNSTGEDFYITSHFDEENYVDSDGNPVGDWSDMRDTWYDDYMETSNYKDVIVDHLAENDPSDVASEVATVIGREVDTLGRQIGRISDETIIANMTEKKARLEKQLDAHEALDYDDEDAVRVWLDSVDEDHLLKGAENDSDVKDIILEHAQDSYAWEDDGFTNVETYKTPNGDSYDTLEEAQEAMLEDMYEDYHYRETEATDEGDIHEGYTIDGGDDYRVSLYEMPNMKHADDKDVFTEGHWSGTEQGGENLTVHSRMKDRTDNDGTVGTVSEEIQSQARQTYDEGGGRGSKPSPEKVAEIQTELDTIKSEIIPMNSIITREEDALDAYRREVHIPAIDALELQHNGDRGAMVASSAYKDLMRTIRAKDRVVFDLDDKRASLMRKRADLESKLVGEEGSPYNEPPMEAQNYEKMVTYDNIMEAVNSDQGFYGSNNGQTSNGWDVTDRPEIGGMVEAYNHRIPKIMKEITGQDPYVAYYSGNQSDPERRKYWKPAKDVEQSLQTKGGKPLSNYSKEYNESPKDWYWRVDLTPEVKAKLKDSKMELYSMGGAGMALINTADDEEIKDGE